MSSLDPVTEAARELAAMPTGPWHDPGLRIAMPGGEPGEDDDDLDEDEDDLDEEEDEDEDDEDLDDEDDEEDEELDDEEDEDA